MDLGKAVDLYSERGGSWFPGDHAKRLIDNEDWSDEEPQKIKWNRSCGPCHSDTATTATAFYFNRLKEMKIDLDDSWKP
jgi:hypothetical protein